jgi:hypothetical protein
MARPIADQRVGFRNIGDPWSAARVLCSAAGALWRRLAGYSVFAEAVAYLKFLAGRQLRAGELPQDRNRQENSLSKKNGCDFGPHRDWPS